MGIRYYIHIPQRQGGKEKKLKKVLDLLDEKNYSLSQARKQRNKRLKIKLKKVFDKGFYFLIMNTRNNETLFNNLELVIRLADEFTYKVL